MPPRAEARLRLPSPGRHLARRRTGRQPVTAPADRVDDAVAQLTPQRRDVDLHDIRAGIELDLPDLSQEFLTREHLSRVAQEGGEQGGLARREDHRAAVDA